MLSGASICLYPAAGVMLPLKPDELSEVSRSLRIRVPQLFERP
jgi:hypothetical protein